MPDTKALS